MGCNNIRGSEKWWPSATDQNVQLMSVRNKNERNVCPISVWANDDRIQVVLFALLGLNWSEEGDRTLKSTEDLRNWLDSAYSYLAMVNYPYSSEFMMPLPGHPIREVSWVYDTIWKTSHGLHTCGESHSLN